MVYAKYVCNECGDEIPCKLKIKMNNEEDDFLPSWCPISKRGAAVWVLKKSVD
jgi:hypothetical protein